MSDDGDESESDDIGANVETVGVKSNFVPCDEEDENARNADTTGSNFSFLQPRDNTNNTIDLESVAENTKTSFILCDDQNENSTIVDYEMADKSKSSATCGSMRSAMSRFGLSSELTEKQARRDVVLTCRDYADDIHSYLREMEVCTKVNLLSPRNF